MPRFPAAADLPPGSHCVVTYFKATTRHQDAADIVGAARQAYQAQAGEPGDVVMLVVQKGRGKPFAEGISASFVPDPDHQPED